MGVEEPETDVVQHKRRKKLWWEKKRETEAYKDCWVTNWDVLTCKRKLMISFLQTL